jgi:hypothetical protein
MKIAIGCDPNAADLKKAPIAFIQEKRHEATDYGGDDPVCAAMAIKTSVFDPASRSVPRIARITDYENKVPCAASS